MFSDENPLDDLGDYKMDDERPFNKGINNRDILSDDEETRTKAFMNLNLVGHCLRFVESIAYLRTIIRSGAVPRGFLKVLSYSLGIVKSEVDDIIDHYNNDADGGAEHCRAHYESGLDFYRESLVNSPEIELARKLAKELTEIIEANTPEMNDEERERQVQKELDGILGSMGISTQGFMEDEDGDDPTEG